MHTPGDCQALIVQPISCHCKLCEAKSALIDDHNSLVSVCSLGLDPLCYWPSPCICKLSAG